MSVGLGPRFLIEAGFLIAVAVGAGIARLGTGTIIAVMAGAWLCVAAVELAVSRARAARARPDEAPETEATPAPQAEGGPPSPLPGPPTASPIPEPGQAGEPEQPAGPPDEQQS